LSEIFFSCDWALEVSCLYVWALEVSCLCAWAFVIFIDYSENPLKCKGTRLLSVFERNQYNIVVYLLVSLCLILTTAFTFFFKLWTVASYSIQLNNLKKFEKANTIQTPTCVFLTFMFHNLFPFHSLPRYRGAHKNWFS